MKIEDCQYLATPHPFKGLRVYVCEPQGLKNASEHAYERLALVYGDMCAEDRMTRMADGLYILGNTLESLLDNFIKSQILWINTQTIKIDYCPTNNHTIWMEKEC